MRTLIIICYLLSSLIYEASAQSLQKHRWNNRLLIIKTSDESSSVYREQIEELITNTEGLKERKLIVYTIQGEKYKQGIDEMGGWKKVDSTSDFLVSSGNDFSISLVGLDGGVKLVQDQLLSSEKLFAIIDAMPMRRREIGN